MVSHFVIAAMLLTQPAQQFDLICTGTISSGSNLTAEKVNPTSSRYRIDLSRMVWCADDCGTPRSIVRANSAELVLIDDAKPDGSLTVSTTINRTTGALRSRLETRMNARDYIYVNTDAVCQRADYTPIPQAAF